ncbi:MAG: ABC transporter permease [Spirochaetaceae bacterium]|nr:ABC transporter permease [Spirochaetaceae bacterium]
MRNYIVKRTLMVLFITLGVTFIVFTIMNIIPGDPGRLILGMNAAAEDVAGLNHELGVDRPFFIRYISYITNALQGDFGLSYHSRRPVVENIKTAFPYTITLAVLGVAVAYLLGIPIGIVSAIRRYSAVDIGSTLGAMFFASIPQFWLALLLMLLFSLKLGWLPPSGVQGLRNFIMPVITMALPIMAIISRLTRTSMLDCLKQDYIRTVRAQGAPESVVIWRHALKNALLPIIITLIITFGSALGGTVIIENIFSIPGMGNLILTAIRQKDDPVVLTATIMLSVMYCLFMLVGDLLMAYLDPRIRQVYLRKNR